MRRCAADCGSNCCNSGFRCCKSPSGEGRCQSRFVFRHCTISTACCSDPNNPCAPESPSPEPPAPDLPLPEDDPSDDSECCADGEECCNGSCVAKLDGTSGLQRVCLGRRGCCPLPPSNGECEANCCPPDSTASAASARCSWASPCCVLRNPARAAATPRTLRHRRLDVSSIDWTSRSLVEMPRAVAARACARRPVAAP
eukprot:jgi/Ulvmu1/3383/UM158_0006.1